MVPTFAPRSPDALPAIRRELSRWTANSSQDQLAGLEAQVEALLETGCQDKIFSEQVSSVAKRDQLEAALDFVREGDTLVVTRLDRLARSTADLLSIVSRLDDKGVGLRIIDFGGDTVDTKSPSGRMLLTMFAAVAQFEREVMLVRQREGISKAKAAGKYKGRAPTARAKTQEIVRLRQEGLGASQIAEDTGVSRSSVYRILADHSDPVGAAA